MKNILVNIVAVSLFMGVVGGGIYAYQRGVFSKLSIFGEATLCSEDPIREIGNGFNTSPDSAHRVPEFETVIVVPRRGEDRGGIGDVWVTDGKLAYVIGRFQENNRSEQTLYYNNAEIDREFLYNFSALKNITDRLAYIKGTEVVYGDQRATFPDINVLIGENTQILDGQLYVKGATGRYYGGEKLSKDNTLFPIGDSVAEMKAEDLGTHPVTFEGESVEVPVQKLTFVYKGKTYGAEFDGFTGNTVALCNGKPVYAVHEGQFLSEGRHEYVIYNGRPVGGPYVSISQIKVIGGEIVFVALKERSSDRVSGTDKYVLVKNGVEVSDRYDALGGFMSHNGHLAYIGIDVESLGPYVRQVNGLTLTSTDRTYTYYVVQDGQEIYKTAREEQIEDNRYDRTSMLNVGGKLALRTYSNSDESLGRLMYDGAEILPEYRGKVRDIFNLNDRLGVLISPTLGNDGDSMILLENPGAGTLITNQEGENIKISPTQERFDAVAKNTPLEGFRLSSGDDDYLDGGPDTDTAAYSGKRDGYELYRGSDAPQYGAYNTFLVVDRRSGAVDTVVNVEILNFADQTISLPEMKVLEKRLVPVAASTAHLTGPKDRVAVQNEEGRTVSVSLAGTTDTTAVLDVLFESTTQKLLSIPKGETDIVVLGTYLNGPRLSITVDELEKSAATVSLKMF